MARRASPWFWEERQGWYVNKDGQRHLLGEHPAGAPAPKQNSRSKKWNAPPAIVQAFHELMAAKTEVKAPDAPTSPDGFTVAEILDKFLDWCEKNREPRTFEWYRDHIQDFLDWNPALAHFRVSELKPYHVAEWADSHGKAWSNAYRRGGIIAIQRPFNWAAELGYIPASLVLKVPKPKAQRRENPVTVDDFAGIIARYAEGDPFRDLLEFAWHSGCRPQESVRIEGRHVRLDDEMIVIPAEEAKGRRRARVIHLQGRALEIIKRLLAERPSGKLFRNEDGL
jgi:integrase